MISEKPRNSKDNQVLRGNEFVLGQNDFARALNDFVWGASEKMLCGDAAKECCVGSQQNDFVW